MIELTIDMVDFTVSTKKSDTEHSVTAEASFHHMTASATILVGVTQTIFQKDVDMVKKLAFEDLKANIIGLVAALEEDRRPLKQKMLAQLPFLNEDDFDTHESDLYVKHDLRVMAWLKHNYEFHRNCKTFWSPARRIRMIDIPFGYLAEHAEAKGIK